MDVTPKTEWILLLAALAYFLGWAYLGEYFGFFGLPLASLNVPLEHYFAYAFAPLWSWLRDFHWLGFVVLLLALSVWTLSLLKPNRLAWLVRWGTLVASVALLVFGFLFARDRALADAMLTAQGTIGKPIFVAFKPEYEERLRARGDPVLGRNAAGDLRLIWQGSGFVFVAISDPRFGQATDGGSVLFFPSYRFSSGDIEYTAQFDRTHNRRVQ